MTRMMNSADRREFPSQPPPGHYPRYLARPGPTQSSIPRRYEPYRSSASTSSPRRLPRPSMINIPRLPPVPHSTPSPEFRTGPKNYDPLRPEGLYQASKGARRDIKWMQKHVERSSSGRPTQPDVPLPPYSPRSSLSGRRGPGPHLPRPDRGSIGARPPGQPKPSPAPVQYLKRGSQGSGSGPIDTKAQEAFIAAAEARYIREKQDQKKLEWGRKVKRIQMQVFVHARPTPCPWGSCPALLNSWALLEKHIHHAHLHPKAAGMPEPGKPVTCKFEACDQVFGTGGECYQHCLSAHMGPYGARCPFNCAYEGPSFDELMAHIERRHRKATPDDFVPGLIHHTPPNLPPASALPKLPTSPVPSTAQSTVSAQRAATAPSLIDDQIQPFPDNASPKVISLVGRKCFSQKKPLPDNYVKMKGSHAAIGAILENAQRDRLSARAIPTSNLRRSIPGDEAADTDEISDPIQGCTQQGLYHSPRGSKVPLLDLLDVHAEKKRGEREAKAQIKRLIDSGQAISDRPKPHRFWTRSHSGESDSTSHTNLTENERTDEWYQARHRKRLVASIQRRTIVLSDDSDSATGDGDSDTASASSSYVPRRRDTTGSAQPIRLRTRMSR